MPDYQTIQYERADVLGTLSLARPEKRNAQNPLMWQELAQLCTELLADPTLRCLVVTGDGPSFSAGIDLVEGLARMTSDFAAQTGVGRSLDAGSSVAGTFRWWFKFKEARSRPVFRQTGGTWLTLGVDDPIRLATFVCNGRSSLRNTRVR